jgi:hypothetical protein
MSAQEDSAQDGDSFDDEVPTVGNRANPTTTSAVADDAKAADRTPGIGAYRLVRPSTSDTLPPPLPSKPAGVSSARVVIGVARKMP